MDIGLAGFATPRELVEADRSNGPEQPHPRYNGQEEGHERHAGGHHHGGKAHHRIDQPGKDDVAAEGEEIVQPLPQ